MASNARPSPRSLFDLRIAPVVAFAAAVNLTATMRALWTFVRGRRVRGWNALCAEANRHSAWSAYWQHAHKVALLRGARRIIEERGIPPVRLAAIIVGGPSDPDAVVRTIKNVSAMLGNSLIVAASEDDASNDSEAVASLTQAHWDWLLVLRPGDTIDPSLPEVLRLAAADTSGREAWFWDSFDVNAMAPIIKPDWDPILDRSIDLLAGSLMVSRAIYDEVVATKLGTTIALEVSDAARSSLKGPGHLSAMLSFAGATTVRPIPSLNGPLKDCPMVSIIILTRDRSDLLIPLFAMLDHLDYQGQVERIVVDNGSTESELISFLEAHEAQGGLRWLRCPGPFNFAALNNAAVAEARGEMLCLLNNDIEPQDRSWLSHMVRRAIDPTVGAVGAMLLYPNGTIQHAGVAIGVGNAAGHVQRFADPCETRFANWHAMSRRVAAVTAACLVIRKAAFEKVGGFDSQQFPVAFNDVDLCLRLQAEGLHNIYEAKSRLIHHESLSRGRDNSPENSARFAAELAALRLTWHTDTREDNFWSPLFLRTSEQCLLVP